MRNIFKIGILAASVWILAVSCGEDQIATYSGPDAANLQINRKDSAEISFLSFEPSVSEYIFEVEVQVQSVLSDKNREVKVGIGEKTTAVAGTNFEMPDHVVIPAGAVSVVLPVKVFKEGLADIDGGVVVEIVVLPSADFVGGVKAKMKLSFSGDFPKAWYASNDVNTASRFLGKCTKAKYQFVYDYLGTIDLAPYSDWTYTKMQALVTDLNTALDKYAADHGGERLKDDDGSDMRFSANT